MAMKYSLPWISVSLSLIIFSAAARAGEQAGSLAGAEVSMLGAAEKSMPDWLPSIRAGYIHQFDADIDDGGSFAVDRANLRVGLNRVFDRDRSVGISLGYDYAGYNFDGLSHDLWSDIHTFRLSSPVRWGAGEKWTIFGIPSVRSSAESGASFNDGVTAGLLAGATYKFSDRLSIGPGLGAFSQLEDSANVFPILLIKWQITDGVFLETGRGFGASQGPGLNLTWQATKHWKVTMGGRYEKFRFRLDDEGMAADGVGQEKGIPLYLGAAYSTSRTSELAVYVGVKLAGSLTLEDDSGDRVSRSDHDPAPFAGASWRYGF